MRQWYYHADFPEGKIFTVGAEPKGCVDHPDDIKAKAPKKKKAVKAKEVESAETGED